MRYLLSLFLLSTLFLSGCTIGEWLTRDVQKEEIQAQKNIADKAVADAQKIADEAAKALAEAKIIAEKTGDERAMQAVSVLAKAAATATDILERARKVSDTAQSALNALPEGGSQRWQVGLAMAWPFALPLLTKIPYIGPFISLAAPLIERATSSSKQKAEWETTEARSKALTHQTDFANSMLNLAVEQAKANSNPDAVKKAMATIQAIKDDARHAQERDGVAVVVRQEVLQHAPV